MSNLPNNANFLARVATSTNQQMAADVELIPKEQLTAYQRWELPSFNPAPAPAHTAMTAERLQKLKQRAQEEGAAAGQASGYTEGYAAGYANGAQQAQQEASEMHALLENLHLGLAQLDQEVAQGLLDLAINIARKMTVETLQVKPEIILETIRSAVSSLPQFNQNPHLILHPDDAELVHRHMNEELQHAGWKIFTDPHMQRGGALVKTAHSLVDASVEARWERIMQSFGQDHSWLG